MKRLFKIFVFTAGFLGVIGLPYVLSEPQTTPATAAAPAAATETAKPPQVIKPGEIKISAEYGRIVETFDGGSDKLVIHMQDAHTNYEAQKNAAMIIEELINKYKLYLILVEGGSRDVTLNRYRDGTPLEERKKNADQMLKEGQIAGEEYLNIASDYPMKLQGMEDRALYDQNMEAFLGVDKYKAEALALTGAMDAVMADLKPKVYSKALKELDNKRLEFKGEQASLSDYAKYLEGLAKSKKIDFASLPNYKNLVDSISLEKAIDFNIVEKERAEVIDVLGKNMGADELNELLTKSVEFKSGQLTQAQYHTYLSDMIARAKIDIKKYPNLAKYITYVINYAKIDSAGLFKEIKSVEEKIEQALATDDEQKRLLKISKNLELFEGFIELKLSPDDFDYYEQNAGDFIIPEWARFLNSEALKYKLTRTVPDDTSVMDKIIPPVKDFYAAARKRDIVFLNNTKKYMDAEKVNIAVLIAGGFHTPSLMRLFRENKISYIVIAPKVVKPTDEQLYHKILTEGWAPANK